MLSFIPYLFRLILQMVRAEKLFACQFGSVKEREDMPKCHAGTTNCRLTINNCGDKRHGIAEI